MIIKLISNDKLAAVTSVPLKLWKQNKFGQLTYDSRKACFDSVFITLISINTWFKCANLGNGRWLNIYLYKCTYKPFSQMLAGNFSSFLFARCLIDWKLIIYHGDTTENNYLPINNTSCKHESGQEFSHAHLTAPHLWFCKPCNILMTDRLHPNEQYCDKLLAYISKVDRTND